MRHLDGLTKTYHRKKLLLLFIVYTTIGLFLGTGIFKLMVTDAAYYSAKADELHSRERSIKAKRGDIIDVHGKVLASNISVCTVSVIHNQITDPEQVIQILSTELGIDELSVRKRVEKYSSIERIKSNVDKVTADKIRLMGLDGVKVDEDYKRYYPYGDLASKVLGFTGGDNQGIIGLEVKYDSVLEGKSGTILTQTTARGTEIAGAGEERIDPIQGETLQISMDLNIQSYAAQLACQTLEQKKAKGVTILVMNPQNGEMYALADVPEYDLNDPYALPDEIDAMQLTEREKQDALNAMWRNTGINDTYEPGSTFKVITAAAGLSSGAVAVGDQFSCPGYVMVEDRKIRCHKAGGHGGENFIQATMNSCNPVFVTVGMRMGVDTFYSYFEQFGLLEKTGIDLPGEANTIMHKPENMKAVELATVSFGQSFQITPIQLATTVSSIINGGDRITPHFGIRSISADKQNYTELSFSQKSGIVTDEVSQTMREILYEVVENGGGKNAIVEGFEIGGKTATSETLPRGTGRYISSFLGFAPADDPKVLALVIIREPEGQYYGGQIAAPVAKTLFENILPYMLQG